MYGNLLDLVLVVAALIFAVTGFRQGFVVGALSFLGFFGGSLLGLQMSPTIAEQLDATLTRTYAALAVVFGTAAVGQLLAVSVGNRIRTRLHDPSLRLVDSAGGSLMSVVALLLVAWMVAVPLASSSSPAMASAVRRSAVINTVDRVVPDGVRNLYASFGDLVQRGDFPEVFGGLTPTEVTGVSPPNSALARSAVVRNAERSVVKVLGSAPSCGRRLAGTGFVYARQRVMTNAHVVAGVRTVRVESDGRRYDARVVVYDPQRDLAVLYVPRLTAPALRFAGPARTGADAIVLGYPLDGPYTATAARIRDRRLIQGPDIYHDTTVRRQVYTLRSQVRSGNSGGPLMAPNGTVYGVIFAAAVDDPETGFALTADEASPVAARGRAVTAAVSTRSCD